MMTMLLTHRHHTRTHSQEKKPKQKLTDTEKKSIKDEEEEVRNTHEKNYNNALEKRRQQRSE